MQLSCREHNSVFHWVSLSISWCFSKKPVSASFSSTSPVFLFHFSLKGIFSLAEKILPKAV